MRAEGTFSALFTTHEKTYPMTQKIAKWKTV